MNGCTKEYWRAYPTKDKAHMIVTINKCGKQTHLKMSRDEYVKIIKKFPKGQEELY